MAPSESQRRGEATEGERSRGEVDVGEALAASAALREAGRLEEVRESLLSLRSEAPDNAQVALECAWIHDVMGLEREAAGLYREAIDLGLEGEPLREALLGLGSTLRVLGEIEASVETLRRGAALYPGAREFTPFLALSLASAGGWSESVGLLLRELVETTSDPDIARYRTALSGYAGEFLPAETREGPEAVHIRVEGPGDAAGVRAVNESAFGGPVEAEIVDRLRPDCPECVSLVAEADGIVGHILFSPAVVSGDRGVVRGMGLGPMAVAPGLQRRGIGSALVERGLGLLRRSGCPFVVVLGHPSFYPRFGFEPASRWGLGPQWEGIPDEAFMILVFDAGATAGVSGVVRYREEFDGAVG
jgi:putative acetyltransferase